MKASTLPYDSTSPCHRRQAAVVHSRGGTTRSAGIWACSADERVSAARGQHSPSWEPWQAGWGTDAPRAVWAPTLLAALQTSSSSHPTSCRQAAPHLDIVHALLELVGVGEDLGGEQVVEAQARSRDHSTQRRRLWRRRLRRAGRRRRHAAEGPERLQ
eukprot:5041111-Prymnesium_polylepis.1